MSFEQKDSKFNINNFKSEFKSTLEKYVSTVNNYEHKSNYEEKEELPEIEENKLGLEINKWMNKLVSISVKALKLADNKQEILEAVSQIFFNLYEDTESQNWSEKEYFKKIVLELLCTKE